MDRIKKLQLVIYRDEKNKAAGLLLLLLHTKHLNN